MNAELQILALLILLPVLTSSYVTNHDRMFNFTCPQGEGISNIGSEHSNYHGDRTFNFTCRGSPTIGRCRWPEYANEFGGNMLFQCPNNSVISGVESYHLNNHEDRRFKFYCCYLGMLLSDCIFSDYANELDATFNYNVPLTRMLRGIFSYYDTAKEDRRFKFETCGISLSTVDQKPVKGIDYYNSVTKYSIKT